jgi:PAS domain S-box-containing protein
MLAQSLGGMTFSLVCAILSLVILGMAANEWRRLRSDKYKRITLASSLSLLGRMAGLVVLLLGFQPLIAYQEWALEILTLAFFVWAFLFDSFSSPRQAFIVVVLPAVVTAGLLILCLLLGEQSLLSPWLTPAWLASLLLLSVFALLQWARNRQRFSQGLGIAFGILSLGAASGLLGFRQGTQLGYLAALTLFAMETYRAVLGDFGGYGRDLQRMRLQTLEQAQYEAFLLEVSRAIAASLDQPDILERGSELLARAIDADWAYVLLPLQENAEQLAVAARYTWWGRRWIQESTLSKKVVVRLDDFSLLRHAFLRQRTVLANEPADYDGFDRLHNLLARPQNGPALIQPVFLQDRSLGLLLFGRIETAPREGGERGRSFSKWDAELCQTLAAQVATAMDNARLYHRMAAQVRQASEGMRAREEKIIQFQAILESIADGVIVAEQGGEVILANAAAERLLGVPRQRLRDQVVEHLFSALLQDRQEHTSDGVAFEWGDKVMVGSLSAVSMLDGAALGYVAVFRDVTRERQAAQVRAGSLLAVSHQLQAILGSLKGEIALLAASAAGHATPEHRQLLDLVDGNTERLIYLVNNLAVMAEMEQGAIQIEPGLVDVRTVIGEAVQCVHPETGPKALELAVSVPPDLSPAWGDRVWLRQIVGNLLENAVHATQENGRIAIWVAEAHLESEGAAPGNYLVVSVRDGGAGLLAEAQEDHLDEKQRSVDGPFPEALAESSLRLAVTQGLVEAHGGRIWTDSQGGEGTTFSFSIPMAASSP